MKLHVKQTNNNNNNKMGLIFFSDKNSEHTIAVKFFNCWQNKKLLPTYIKLFANDDSHNKPKRNQVMEK